MTTTFSPRSGSAASNTPRPVSPDGSKPVPALDADRLYRFFRAGEEETLALQGVSLTVHAGETVAVRGPSGSGKSTLLACLAGLDEPAGGTVRVAGTRISHRPERDRAAIRATQIGILLQSRNLLPHLDLTANIRLAQRAAPADRSRPWASARTHPRPTPTELLSQVGLSSRSHAVPRQLSGGELARAGLAVALANTPALILADEPTGELDAATEEHILALLRDRAQAGAGVLIVTHSREVTASADRVITLSDGRILS